MARNTRANLREVAAPVTWKLILQSLELYMLYENTTGLTWTDSVDPVDLRFHQSKSRFPSPSDRCSASDHWLLVEKSWTQDMRHTWAVQLLKLRSAIMDRFKKWPYNYHIKTSETQIATTSFDHECTPLHTTWGPRGGQRKLRFIWAWKHDGILMGFWYAE